MLDLESLSHLQPDDKICRFMYENGTYTPYGVQTGEYDGKSIDTTIVDGASVKFLPSNIVIVRTQEVPPESDMTQLQDHLDAVRAKRVERLKHRKHKRAGFREREDVVDGEQAVIASMNSFVEQVSNRESTSLLVSKSKDIATALHTLSAIRLEYLHSEKSRDAMIAEVYRELALRALEK